NRDLYNSPCLPTKITIRGGVHRLLGGNLMRILVAVASKHGSTREIAEAIAQELKSQGLDVDLQPVETVIQVSNYDAVVFGSAIYAGSWLPAAKRFAETFRT